MTGTAVALTASRSTASTPKQGRASRSRKDTRDKNDTRSATNLATSGSADWVALYRRERALSQRRNKSKAAELRALVEAAKVRVAEATAPQRRGRPKAERRTPESPSYAQRDRREYDRAYYKANRDKKVAQAKASYYRRKPAA
jgi:hypothetical protein